MSWLVECAGPTGADAPDESRYFPEKFAWLHSEYSANTWLIRDPTSSKNPKLRTINFDKRISVNIAISDIPFAIEDLKRFLCIAIEASSLGLCQYSVSSTSTARSFIDSLKRIFVDIYALTGGGSMREIKSFHVEQLLIGLRETARYHHSVRKRVHKVLQNKLHSLPRHDRHDNRIGRKVIYGWAGVDEWTARKDPVIVGWFDQIDLTLFMNEKVVCPSLPEEEPSFVHPKQYETVLKALSSYIEVLDLFPDYFGNRFRTSVLTKPVDHYLKEANFSHQMPANTKNIPPKTFLHFMDAAARYVLDYSDALFELEDRAVDFYNSAVEKYASRGTGKPEYQAGKDTNTWIGQQAGPSGPHTPFPLQAFKQSQRRRGASSGYLLSLRNALYGFLPASCLMIIYALSARRENEVLSLQAGCYREDEHGPSVKFYVEKTERDYRWFSTVPLAIRALKILERLSESARLETGSTSLMIFKDSRRAGAIGTFNRLLDSVITRQFFDYIELPKEFDDDWQQLSEHQFRRFFAIMYFYRYEGTSSVEALMREMGHSDWTMTKTYLTELEAGKIFQQIEEERIVDYGLQAITDQGIGGGMAEVFRSKFASGLMVPHNPHREVVLEYVRENDYVIEFISEGVCFGFSKGRAARSNCFESGSVMCHRASSVTCKGCPNLLSVPDVKRNYFPDELKPLNCEESIILAAAKERGLTNLGEASGRR